MPFACLGSFIVLTFFCVYPVGTECVERVVTRVWTVMYLVRGYCTGVRYEHDRPTVW